MSFGVADVMLVGNLGSDPEKRYTTSGKAVATFKVACNNGKDHTEWVRCVAWDRIAENISEHCRKGTQVYVSGRLQTRKYQSNGEDKYVTECVVREVIFMGSPEKPKDEPKPAFQPTTGGELEDDIPF